VEAHQPITRPTSSKMSMTVRPDERKETQQRRASVTFRNTRKVIEIGVDRAIGVSRHHGLVSEPQKTAREFLDWQPPIEPEKCPSRDGNKGQSPRDPSPRWASLAKFASRRRPDLPFLGASNIVISYRCRSNTASKNVVRQIPV
jgi:hypothetical protein